jgi:hypothetical protein|tara:strand:+ start:61 stop:237 length:177 start_codon:yes stop_codon:yes gene_type:complete
MDETLLEHVIIDIASRKFVLISDTGERKELDCPKMDQFMSVLNFIREMDYLPAQLTYV